VAATPEFDPGKILFGANADPVADRLDEAFTIAKIADDNGLDLIGIQDHPYNHTFVDTMALIGTIVPMTTRVHLFPNVADLPLRPPAMLAKHVATLDRVSRGRIELGLGAGAFWEGIRAMGGPVRRPAEAVEALEEAIQVIRLLWSEERSVTFRGKYYWLQGARPGPPPSHNVGIWIGAIGPRMLALTGRLADGWSVSSSYVSPEELPAKQQKIDAAAKRAGRNPAHIRRLYNLMGRITPNGTVAHGTLDGPTAHWVDELMRLITAYGMNAFVFWPLEDRPAQIERFAKDVVPALRDHLP
jgi:alkanesulfonate monooxygenase SsuD/methylene tetrahydromethanopterin reductase-like flavin-dependent oxidoreductase (luciferase family)